MPNSLAYIALFCWPLVVVVLFKRLPVPSALVWSMLGGYLFLPPETGIDLPVLPALDKTTIPSFAAGIMCLFETNDRRRRRARERSGGRALRPIILSCLSALVLATILTVVRNSEPLLYGSQYFPGLSLYDTGSMILSAALSLLPFILARRHLTSRDAQLSLLRAIVVLAMIYSALILVEVRLSPQLNMWLYGFHASSFAQHIRFGGYRPMVFLEHGLRVGIFVAMAVLAALVLWRSERSDNASQASSGRRQAGSQRSPQRWLLAAGWLFVALFLSKTVGAFAITTLLVPTIFLLAPRGQSLVAIALAAAVLVFPMLRGAGFVPTDTLVSVGAAVDTDRAESLAFRFRNEDILLAKANEKPLFGWGSWGRNRVYDHETGNDLSVTDGTWVIMMGTYGWVGYLARFGLLTLPIIALFWRRRVDTLTAGLSIVLAANLVDVIPNSGLTPLTWMLAGTVSVSALASQRATEPEKAPARERKRRTPSAARRPRA